MTTRRYKADVAVVGGGIAGIVTALELLDESKRVVVLDRDTADRFGGLAREAFGAIFFVDSPEQRRLGIRDSRELALDEWLSVAQFDETDHWPRQWAEAYVDRCTEDVYHWLRERGVGFFPIVHWVERGLFTPGNSVPRFHVVWGTGARLMELLVAHLQTHPRRDRLELCFRHRVSELEVTAGHVTGCSGVEAGSGERFSVDADAVVVASGGIGGAVDRVRSNWYEPWGDPPDVLLNGAHRYGIGELHDVVAATGGALTNFDLHWTYPSGIHHPRPDRKLHGLSLIPPKSALWVNARGERIGPMPLVTGFDNRFLVEQICRQPGKFSWQVMNWKIACREIAISGAQYNNSIRERRWFRFIKGTLTANPALMRELAEMCEDVVVADALPELIDRMQALNLGQQLDGDRMEAEIRRYDANVARGRRYHNDEQLRRIAQARRYISERVRTCKFQQILDPRARPLVAIREFILTRKTLGGIQTDLGSRVLAPDGTPIPGLFAVGEAAGYGGGGMHGKGSLEGTFLGGCVLTARAAARALCS